ncbi:MAG: hypothetical protein UU93_C0001G0062 [Candidatus Amesbacteria bacterium GW2011_GWA2_42_12]|uniref:YYY membrane protein n=1 Tax=Candidatus Amesbacteria bacterium GW2011_GWA2_42_12 TaxID=1618356 RepID=A0A0G1AGK3_9BACT|nr:MAG: hypothetical protein UU93_C0001G0062 [Candidatus Amesbacteria bacterium GW2011_GWA2_42_12]
MLTLLLLLGWTFIFRKLLNPLLEELPNFIRLVISFLITNIFIGYAVFGLGFLVHQSLIIYIFALVSMFGFYVFFKDKLYIGLERKELIVGLLSTVFFVWLYLIVWIGDGNGINLAIRGVWSDWGNHLGLPIFYKSIDRTTFFNPFASGEKFTYPPISSLLTSVPLHLDQTVKFGIFLFGISWSVAAVILMSLWGSFLGLKKTTYLSSVLLYLNGNLGLVNFVKDLFYSHQSLWQFLSVLPKEYGHNWELGYHLGNFLDFFFVSQRSFILGLPLGIIILLLVTSAKKTSKFLLAGVILGLLPLIHTHTFISLSVILGFVCLLDLKNWKIWLHLWIPTFLLTCPYLVWLYFANTSIHAHSFFALKFGWLSESENILTFWFKNAPLLVVGIIALLTKSVSKKSLPVVIGAWVLFILGNIIQFQPNLADNNKLFVWWYLLAVIYPSLMFFQKISKSWLTVSVLSLATFTGILQLIWITQNNWQFVDKEGLNLARFASHTCPDKRWLTSDAHNYPVFTFAGRPVVMGYRGWLWTWGIDYSSLEKDVRQMFDNPQNSQSLFIKHNVSYAVIGSSEIHQYNNLNIEIWKKLYPIVYSSPSYNVFAISPCTVK